MAAAAILNFREMSITLVWIQNTDIYTKVYGNMHHGHAEMTSWPKVETGSSFAWRRQMNVWTISVLNSVTIADIWTKFYIELKHHTTNTTECSKFIWLENSRWWRPPSWISENVNNSELHWAVCAKFGAQMHHGHAEMTHDQNWKLELFCLTSLLWWIEMYILNECWEHNRCADVKAYKSSQLTNL